MAHAQLTTFVAHLIEAMLWAEHDESTPSGGVPFDANYSRADLAPEALDYLKAQSRRFLALSDGLRAERKDIESYAHDFWLTAHGHGAGFWDGDYPRHGEALTRLCDAHFADFEHKLPYLGDDGRIYL